MPRLKVRIEYETAAGTATAEYEEYDDTPDLVASRLNRVISAGHAITANTNPDARLIIPAARVLNVAVDYA